MTDRRRGYRFLLVFDGGECRLRTGSTRSYLGSLYWCGVSYGAALFFDGVEVASTWGRTSMLHTTNEAEYFALLQGLELALAHGVRRLEVRGDSQLVIRHMQGRYRVRAKNLLPFWEEAWDLCEAIPGRVRFSHHRRETTLARRADHLANLGKEFDIVKNGATLEVCPGLAS